MAAPEVTPTDVLGDDLVAVYVTAIERLELLVADAMRRGLDPARADTPAAQRGDATAAYRARNLAQARAILAGLRGVGARASGPVVARVMDVTAEAVDDALASSAVRARFGTVNAPAAQRLASNMARSLDAAARAAGENVERAFARAAAIDSGGRRVEQLGFVGRRQDDPWRRVALERLAVGQVTGQTGRQVARDLADELVRQGVTDAVTGYVDSAGRRWDLRTYSSMVVRTTTREATTSATVARIEEGGDDLVAISRHAHPPDECSPYDGRTFSLRGRTPGYPVILALPPYHPYCAHIAMPAVASFDAYLGDLRRRAEAARRG